MVTFEVRGMGKSYFNYVHEDSLCTQMSLTGCGTLSSNATLCRTKVLLLWRGGGVGVHAELCPSQTHPLWPVAPLRMNLNTTDGG